MDINTVKNFYSDDKPETPGRVGNVQPNSSSNKGSFLNKLSGKNRKGLVLAVIAVAAVLFLAKTIKVKTSGELAYLALSPASSTVVAGNNIGLDIKLNTMNNPVVVVKAVVDYDKSVFQYVNFDEANSIFSVANGNTCVYLNKPCMIIKSDPAAGRVIITMAKPKPGVNIANGLVGKVNFKVLRASNPSSSNISLNYASYGNYDDSDAILDDGMGNDIMAGATNSTVKTTLPAPTGLNCPAISATQATCTWQYPTAEISGISRYKVYLAGSVPVMESTSGTYTFQSLTPLTSYTFQISAVDDQGIESVQSAPFTFTTLADTTAPAKPTGLLANGITMDSLTLNWSATTDNVGVKEYAVFKNNVEVKRTSQLSGALTGLAPSTSYNFAVAAYDAAGNKSANSDPITVATLDDSRPPTAPTNLIGTASMTQISLSWGASTDNVGVTGYKIFRDGTEIESVGGSVLTYTDSNLTVSTTYKYKVRAADQKNNLSNFSNEITLTTSSDTEKPSVPGNLAASAKSMTEISLTWSASTDNVGVTGYRIFRDGAAVGTTVSTSYADPGLILETSYSYTVAAYDAAGNTSAQQASPVTVKTLADTVPPSVPAGLTAVAASTTQIDLTWQESTDNVGVFGYNLFRNGQKIAEVDTIKEITEYEYQDIGLTAGTQYTYGVSAVDAKGNESARAEKTVTTQFRKYTLTDFEKLRADWLTDSPDSSIDTNGDGKADISDFATIMYNWQY